MGLIIVYAPPSGTAGGATLIDTSDNFPKSLKPMFQLLVQQITGGGAKSTAPASSTSAKPGGTAPAAAPASGAAQSLVPYAFPDQTGAISLPAGWKPTQAHMGDVMATGPNGESLRFGMVIEALDPNLPGSRAMGAGRGVAPGSFVLLPYSEDPAKMYQDALNQLGQKQRLAALTFTPQQVNDQHANPGKNFIMFGTESKTGSAPVDVIVQLLCSPENQMGFEIKIYQVSAPDSVFKQETPMLNSIFPTYTQDPQRISAMATANAATVVRAAQNTIAYERQLTDASDRSTQGMSDYLRGESVFVDNETGQHYRGPDDLAGALSNANPNRFQTLSLSQYISGVDY
jgi:hypothetical protein